MTLRVWRGQRQQMLNVHSPCRGSSVTHPRGEGRSGCCRDVIILAASTPGPLCVRAQLRPSNLKFVILYLRVNVNLLIQYQRIGNIKLYHFKAAANSREFKKSLLCNGRNYTATSAPTLSLQNKINYSILWPNNKGMWRIKSVLETAFTLSASDNVYPHSPGHLLSDYSHVPHITFSP